MDRKQATSAPRQMFRCGSTTLLIHSKNSGLWEALSVALRSSARITLCTRIEDVVPLLQTQPFDAILLDCPPQAKALQMLKSFVAERKIPVLLITSEAAFVRSVFLSGYDSIIEPPIAAAALRPLLAQIKAGHFIAPAWFKERVSQITRLNYGADRSDFIRELHLTPVEVKVLDGIAQHLENKEIAGVLSISEALVRKLIRSASSKLGVRRRTEAAVFWSRLLD